jgi:non-homologous end joining protein Ku
MGRAIWSGVLSFGLVSVPVELYTATEAHGPVFHQFEEGTTDRAGRRDPGSPRDDARVSAGAAYLHPAWVLSGP